MPTTKQMEANVDSQGRLISKDLAASVKQWKADCNAKTRQAMRFNDAIARGTRQQTQPQQAKRPDSRQDSRVVGYYASKEPMIEVPPQPQQAWNPDGPTKYDEASIAQWRGQRDERAKQLMTYWDSQGVPVSKVNANTIAESQARRQLGGHG